MAMFTLEGRSDAEMASLIKDAYTLTDYSYHYLYDGLSWGYQHYGYTWGFALTGLKMLFGNTESQGLLPGLFWNPDTETTQEKINAAGWYTLSADELGYQGKTNAVGTFYGEAKGYKTAEAEILGKYDDNGNLIQIGVAFRGFTGPRAEQITDSIGDMANLVKAALGSEEYVYGIAKEAFGTLLGKVADYARANGLSGADVVVTGSSQGGITVNSMAALSEDNWGGFYSSAAYLPIASPVQYEGENVLNIGYENDPVFRIMDGTEFNLASLGIHDKPHESCTDNLVNFNDFYASTLWGLTPFSFLNLPAWVAHAPFNYIEGLSRIVDSDFYSLTERDSTVIIANLSEPARAKTWVEDLNKAAEKHTGPTFILGSGADDLIAGGQRNDYLEGNGGNDTFRDAGGYNIIHGGDGYNTLDLQHALSKSEIAWDGETLYIREQDGGLTLAQDIDNIRSTETFLWLFKQQKNHLLTEDGLLTDNNLTHYATSASGDEGANTLTAQKAGSWLFGLQGDDTLTGAAEGNTTFVGGEGNDTLYSQGDNNTILFTGDFGQDTLYGFNASDTLLFMGVAGATHGDYEDFLTFEDDNAIFSFGENSVTVVGVNQNAFTEAQIVLA